MSKKELDNLEKNKHSPECKWHKDWHTCNCGHFDRKQNTSKEINDIN